MSVYKRSFQRYQGPPTPLWSRFLILPRYAYEQILRSRFFFGLLLLCFAYPVFCIGHIYLQHNLAAIKAFNIDLDKLLPVDASFFLRFMYVQTGWCFLVTVIFGPGLISPDLANNGLILYLCRPFSRIDYVLGKLSILLLPLSLISWVPGLLVFFLQGYFEGAGWTVGNWRFAVSLFTGVAFYIMTLALLSMAISAWVKWKMVAGAILLGGPLVLKGFGAAINKIFDVEWGYLLDFGELFQSVWQSLIGARHSSPLGTTDAVGAILVVLALSLYLLGRKIKPCEVVA